MKDEDEFFEHFGVRGMKWGVINERKRSSSKPSGSPTKPKYRKDVRYQFPTLVKPGSALASKLQAIQTPSSFSNSIDSGIKELEEAEKKPKGSKASGAAAKSAAAAAEAKKKKHQEEKLKRLEDELDKMALERDKEIHNWEMMKEEAVKKGLTDSAERLDAEITKSKQEWETSIKEATDKLNAYKKKIGKKVKHGDTLEEENFIEHFGVLGMKWGVRKDRSSGKTSKTSGKGKKTKIKDLSDEELRARINRLNMEKQYKSLTEGKKSRGRKFVGQILSKAAKRSLTDFVADEFTRQLKAASARRRGV